MSQEMCQEYLTQMGHDMRQITSIVAVNRDGVIGCRNTLPWQIKSDMAFFRKNTTGNIVVMGRKTHDSLGRCLPNRYNIVLSNQLHLFDDEPNCVLRYGVGEALVEAESAPSQFDEVFVIGGSTMYEQFSPIVDRYLITIVDKPIEDGDAFFDLSLMEQQSDWSVNRICSKRQESGDEAPFEIFELRTRRLHERRSIRQSRIDEVLAKRPTRAKRPGTQRKDMADRQASFAL